MYNNSSAKKALGRSHPRAIAPAAIGWAMK